MQIVQRELPLLQSPTVPVPQPLPDLQSRGVSASPDQDSPDGLPGEADSTERRVSETTSDVPRALFNSSHTGGRTVIWWRRPDGSEQRKI